MSFQHGKNTFVSVGGDDLSDFTTTSQFEQSVATHDTTTYGKNAVVRSTGLKDGTFTMSGVYDNTAGTGPRAVLGALMATPAVVEVIRQPEGTGSGKPQDKFDAICTKYVETNPVADMVTWSADFQLSDDNDATAQPA
jgi:hypothetical protein